MVYTLCRSIMYIHDDIIIMKTTVGSFDFNHHSLPLITLKHLQSF